MVYVKQAVIDNIAQTIGAAKVESGGIIGIYEDIICAYCFDAKGSLNETYDPDIESLNEVIEVWAEQNVQFVGLVHSQKCESKVPSKNDLDYALALKEANPELKRLIFPIINLIDGKINLYFYELIDKEFVQIEVKTV